MGWFGLGPEAGEVRGGGTSGRVSWCVLSRHSLAQPSPCLTLIYSSISSSGTLVSTTNVPGVCCECGWGVYGCKCTESAVIAVLHQYGENRFASVTHIDGVFLGFP